MEELKREGNVSGDRAKMGEGGGSDWKRVKGRAILPLKNRIMIS
jgi:hypothetical protein